MIKIIPGIVQSVRTQRLDMKPPTKWKQVQMGRENDTIRKTLSKATTISRDKMALKKWVEVTWSL